MEILRVSTVGSPVAQDILGTPRDCCNTTVPRRTVIGNSTGSALQRGQKPRIFMALFASWLPLRCGARARMAAHATGCRSTITAPAQGVSCGKNSFMFPCREFKAYGIRGSLRSLTFSQVLLAAKQFQ